MPNDDQAENASLDDADVLAAFEGDDGLTLETLEDSNPQKRINYDPNLPVAGRTLSEFSSKKLKENKITEKDAQQLLEQYYGKWETWCPNCESKNTAIKWKSGIYPFRKQLQCKDCEFEWKQWMYPIGGLGNASINREVSTVSTRTRYSDDVQQQPSHQELQTFLKHLGEVLMEHAKKQTSIRHGEGGDWYSLLYKAGTAIARINSDGTPDPEIATLDPEVKTNIFLALATHDLYAAIQAKHDEHERLIRNFDRNYPDLKESLDNIKEKDLPELLAKAHLNITGSKAVGLRKIKLNRTDAQIRILLRGGTLDAPERKKSRKGNGGRRQDRFVGEQESIEVAAVPVPVPVPEPELVPLRPVPQPQPPQDSASTLLPSHVVNGRLVPLSRSERRLLEDRRARHQTRTRSDRERDGRERDGRERERAKRPQAEQAESSRNEHRLLGKERAERNDSERARAKRPQAESSRNEKQRAEGNERTVRASERESRRERAEQPAGKSVRADRHKDRSGRPTDGHASERQRARHERDARLSTRP